jgi:PhoH-like ATPase
MKKIYVLDTNVLINDPNAFLSFEKNDTVVIPYKVVEELEKHKIAPGDLGASARACSRAFMAVVGNETQSTLKTGLKLENGSLLKVMSSQDFKHHESVGSLKSGDDHILAVATGLHRTEKNAKVVMVSEDMMLKIRANSFGIPVQSYGEQAQTSLKDLYSGNKHIEVNDGVLSRYWEEEPRPDDEEPKLFSLLPKEITKEKLVPNEFVVLGHGGNSKPYPLLRCVDKARRLRFVKKRGLEKLKPLNIEQVMAIDLLMDPKVQLVSLMGQAGTGKTILSIEAGLNQVIGQSKNYKSLIILRPVHPVGKDIGYLPGSKEEKLEPWIAPIKDNLRQLMGTGKKSKRNESSLDHLFERGIIEVEAMAFIRGRSINNAFILVDESQNLNRHELKTILTRVGKGTKVVLTGDIEQTDRADVGTLTNGLTVAIEKFKKHGISGHVTLKVGVRSELSALAAKVL